MICILCILCIISMHSIHTLYTIYTLNSVYSVYTQYTYFVYTFQRSSRQQWWCDCLKAVNSHLSMSWRVDTWLTRITPSKEEGRHYSWERWVKMVWQCMICSGGVVKYGEGSGGQGMLICYGGGEPPVHGERRAPPRHGTGGRGHS